MKKIAGQVTIPRVPINIIGFTLSVKRVNTFFIIFFIDASWYFFTLGIEGNSINDQEYKGTDDTQKINKKSHLLFSPFLL
jgi:hypothetical protein